jgi:hypothetical protein
MKNVVLQCPQCKRPVHWNAKSPQRPFCSTRCQQLDFGCWANEEHLIPGQALESLDGSDEDGELSY